MWSLDHADIYDDLKAVKTAFRRLVNLVPRRGRVIAFDGSANVDDCIAPRLLHRRALRVQAGFDLANRGVNPRRQHLYLEDPARWARVAAGKPAHARRNIMH